MKYDRKVREIVNTADPTGPRPEGGEALHQPSVNGNNIPQNTANANSQGSNNELQRNHEKIRSGDCTFHTCRLLIHTLGLQLCETTLMLQRYRF